MSVVTMNMSSYEIESADSAPSVEERMFAGGTPALALHPVTESRRISSMPPDMQRMDVDALLDRVYSYQRC